MCDLTVDFHSLEFCNRFCWLKHVCNLIAVVLNSDLYFMDLEDREK